MAYRHLLSALPVRSFEECRKLAGSNTRSATGSKLTRVPVVRIATGCNIALPAAYDHNHISKSYNGAYCNYNAHLAKKMLVFVTIC